MLEAESQMDERVTDLAVCRNLSIKKKVET